MEKKAKVTRITKRDRKDSYGNTYFQIEFDNGESGLYTSKNEEQNKFIVGNVADYILEVKQGPKGDYNKITVPQSANFFKGGGKPPVDPRVQFIGYSAAYSKDLVVAGKISFENMNREAESIFKNMLRIYETIK